MTVPERSSPDSPDRAQSTAAAGSPPTGSAPQPSPGGRLLAYLQLVRIPNVFTAAADVLMGYLVVEPHFDCPGQLPLLVAASCLMYSAGMALNDAYDAPVDARLRPQRPIPSGRVSLAGAFRLGYGLLFAGVLAAWGSAALSPSWAAGAVGTGLAVCVLLYDAWLKRTPLGPLAMGACRMLNVLLGMTAASYWNHPLLLTIAAAIGTYIVGVTWYARTEAETSRRPILLAATVVMMAGIGLLIWAPNLADARLPTSSQPLLAANRTWAVFLAALAANIGYRAMRGVVRPEPQFVQRAVKQAILSLIVLDAAVCFAFRGIGWSLVVLALLLPTLYLGRWIYST